VKNLGVNYLKACVANAFQPAIVDGIKAALEDAKEEAGLGGPEETPVTKLAYNKDEKERDTFCVNVHGSRIYEPHLGGKFIAYNTYVVRICSSGDEKEKQFYVNAQYFDIKYNQLSCVPALIHKDFKDQKLTAFPPSYQIGGPCCFCLEKKAGDKPAHDKAMSDWFKTSYETVPYSKHTADHFRCGDEWEIQQTAKQIFFDAVTNTIADYDCVWNPEIPPFDEVDAVAELCKAVAIKKLLPKVLGPVEKIENPTIRHTLLRTARSGVATAIDTAAGGWAPLGAAATKAGEAATKALKEAAEKIVEALKPLIAKIVGVVKEKNEKKKEKKKKEKRKSDGKTGR